MVKHLRTRSDFEKCLRAGNNGDLIAIFNGFHLRSVYQPIFRRDNSILGFEALVRVQDEQGNNLCPAELFRYLLPTDEAFSDQISVDKLARVIHLRNFARHAGQHWIFLNMLPSSAVASIEKFSSQQLMVERLAELAIPRAHVVLEVVEHLHDDSKRLSFATHQSVENGFKIAIDDYGVGGSQEERVRQMNPSIMKIDRSLLRSYIEGDQDPIHRAIVLAKEVNAQVLVEGVEDKQEYDAMLALEIDYFQGFYLGMPKSIDEYFPANTVGISCPSSA
ncbi:EAL domain-containing protein [Enterovibrio norvegicus]|uniref:EAL domain-containing protein n=1 Tax=Enterovibrio norvegicus TaxID=188144 RepID=A0A2N7LHB0_9GAMM|nr:EAL domain-containing protein [Enterovibrio norvegicus]MCC4798551.1 EAL domain-containing protein [Enterovibrio norvegicus]PMH65432.1 EAL domain-containing protein [Enterovibrio norvegicus]PMI39067.1 EAL domain-containing protein [Enterovibrio norvegicus]PMN49522.1 EAL domain-containing protein [Enterovibrio norvegicus]PMN94930.1 EAL domain-containing protein [Enterovibrio norvegicus]